MANQRTDVAEPDRLTRAKEITLEEDTVYEQITPYIYSAAEVTDGIEKEFMDILHEKAFDILNSSASVGAIGLVLENGPMKS